MHPVYLVTKQTSYREVADCFGAPVGGCVAGLAAGSGAGGRAVSTLLPSSS